MAAKKLPSTDRAATAKKAATLKVEKAKKPMSNAKGQMISRDEAAKQAFKDRLKKP